MERTLPTTWRSPVVLPWRQALFVVLGVVSAFLVIFTPTFTGEDWSVIRHGSQLVLGGQSPFTDPLYRWSPVAAWLTVPLLILPYWAWIGLHVAALAAFRDVRVFAIGLIAAPFWQDAGVGNVLTFVVLAAWWALRGNRWATWAYLLMVLLMPRPLMIPVAAWLLWHDRRLWLPFAGLATVSLLGALLTGYAMDWAGVLAHAGGVEIENSYQIGPSVLIGAAWVPIGLALAAILTWKGRLGLASLAASPYWLPYYLLMGLLELTPTPTSRERQARTRRCRPRSSGRCSTP